VTRVFLDANVLLFSAAWRTGGGLTRLWESASFRLVTSRYAADEAERNLAPMQWCVSGRSCNRS
jgi:predicted nucleic acid-binding protein